MSDVVPLILMKNFFKNPEQTNFSLSPDGQYFAFLQPYMNRLNIHVQKAEGGEINRVTEDQQRDIIAFFWANNTRIAYLQDTGGDENYRLFAVNLDGSNYKELTPFPEVRVQIIDELQDNDVEMLIGLNKRNPQVHDVFRLNIDTGEMTLVAENPGNITGWMTDHNEKLRVALTNDGANQSILYRENENDEFRTIITTNFRETLHPLLFTFDNKHVYMASNIGRDKSAIVKYDLENTKELEVIYEHSEVDVEVLLWSRKRQIISGVSFVTWKREFHFFDDERKNWQDFLQQQLPNCEAQVVSVSKDETALLARTYSDKSLGAYYFYDITAKKLTKLADVGPWLKEEELADMQTVSYTSRDGFTIHGYLTLPKGVQAHNLPTVINPHGGPWARDTWGFNKEVQFLANRGYAVLQINFRGSTGYGRKFWEASFKQWGQTMQDDITDGVNWLIEKGIADPKKIGIYGGSYGGYAVLAGLTFTPDIYACGVDYVGVSNLFTFMNTIPPYWKPLLTMMHEMVGDPEKDKEILHKASPVFHVDKIKAPLFVVQGANDPRVNKNESDQMVEALKTKGIEVPYMVKDDEGHGFLKEENRFDFYRAMERFLADHLSGRAEEA